MIQMFHRPVFHPQEENYSEHQDQTQKNGSRSHVVRETGGNSSPSAGWLLLQVRRRTHTHARTGINRPGSAVLLRSLTHTRTLSYRHSAELYTSWQQRWENHIISTSPGHLVCVWLIASHPQSSTNTLEKEDRGNSGYLQAASSGKAQLLLKQRQRKNSLSHLVTNIINSRTGLLFYPKAQYRSSSSRCHCGTNPVRRGHSGFSASQHLDVKQQITVRLNITRGNSAAYSESRASADWYQDRAVFQRKIFPLNVWHVGRTEPNRTALSLPMSSAGERTSHKISDWS